MAKPVERIRDLGEDEGQVAADAIESLTEDITDLIQVCEVALYNAGLSEKAAERIAKRVAVQVAKNYIAGGK